MQKRHAQSCNSQFIVVSLTLTSILEIEETSYNEDIKKMYNETFYMD